MEARRPKWWGYVRVSTVDQAEGGHSIDAQIRRLKDSYEAHFKDKFDFGGVLVDPAVSGKRPIFKREAGARIRIDVEPGDMLEFCRVDRAFRSTLDAATACEYLSRNKIQVVFQEIPGGVGTPIGRLLFGMMALFAEFESSIISERTKAGLMEARRKGVVVRCWTTTKFVSSGVPHHIPGRKPKRRVVVDPPMFELGQFVIRWRDELKYTWEAIELHMRQFPRPGGWEIKRGGHLKIGKNQRFSTRGDRGWDRQAIMHLYKGAKRTIEWMKAGKIPTSYNGWTYDPRRADRPATPGPQESVAEVSG